MDLLEVRLRETRGPSWNRVVSRTVHTRRHYKDLQEERDATEPPLHSTKITSARISKNTATSKPSYLPDGTAVPDHQGSIY